MWLGATNRAYTPATSFYTGFTGADEDPIRDGSNWAEVANGWQHLRRVGGICKASAYTENFDDAHSECRALPVLANSEAIATLYRQNATFGEYGLLFRLNETTGAPGTSGCYECLLNTGGGVDIVRWNGTLGSFLSILNTSTSPTASIVDGDQIWATCSGNALGFIKFYWRRPSVSSAWTQIADCVADATYTSGRNSPNQYIHATGGNIDDLGYRDFQLNTLP